MLKKRLIAVLPLRQGIVVQSIGFQKYLPVGKPAIAVDFLNRWGVDEIVILDIEASLRGQCIDPKMVQEVSKYTQAPLTVGGGITTTSQMKELVSSGADKISINSAALRNPQLISQGAEIFGNQCIIVAIDIQKTSDGKFEIYDKSGRPTDGLDPVSYAKEVEKYGAGEILLTFVHRDGSKQGYDLELAFIISSAVSIPVIICGGVGHPQHFADGLNVPNISAVAAGNFFHFQEHSVVLAKQYISQHCSQAIRLDSYANYKESQLDASGRLQKKSDSDLEKLFYEFHPKETI